MRPQKKMAGPYYKALNDYNFAVAITTSDKYDYLRFDALAELRLYVKQVIKDDQLTATQKVFLSKKFS